MSIKNFAFAGKYSQNMEQGIIDEAIKRIKPKLKTAVEFGGADGYYCSNTAHLREHGWKVFMYDLKPVEGLVEAKAITPQNVNELPKCSVLSIDTDTNDTDIWIAYSGKPDIVIMEIDSSIDPEQMTITKTGGASFSVMNGIAESKGYFLLAHTGNCIYIRKEHAHLFPDADKTFNTSWLK